MKRGTLSASVVRDVVVISSGTALSQILRLQAGFSRRGLEREGVQIGGGLAVFDTVDDCAQCQSPDLRQGFLPCRGRSREGPPGRNSVTQGWSSGRPMGQAPCGRIRDPPRLVFFFPRPCVEL